MDRVRPKPPAAGKGRPKGALNKATVEIRDLTQRLFDETYWANTRKRLLSGRIAPAVEAKLLAYAYGEPKQTHKHEGLEDLAAALAKKCVDELHPGPSQAA